MDNPKVPTITTTFKMEVPLKKRVKVYLAKHAVDAELRDNGDKVDMSKLLNKGLSLYLDKLEFGESNDDAE